MVCGAWGDPGHDYVPRADFLMAHEDADVADGRAVALPAAELELQLGPSDLAP